MKLTSRHKALFIFPTLIAAIAVGIALRLSYWQSNPRLAFEHFTGRPVPAGIMVRAYSSQANDNLFHFGHYFLLSGTRSSLRQFTVGTTLNESTEDARGGCCRILLIFLIVLGQESKSLLATRTIRLGTTGIGYFRGKPRRFMSKTKFCTGSQLRNASVCCIKLTTCTSPALDRVYPTGYNFLHVYSSTN